MTVTQLFPILLTRDLPRLSRFYELSLGASVDYRFGDPGEEDYISLSVGAATIGIGRDEHAPDAAAGDRVALWFYVDDVEDAYRNWLQAGGGVVQEPVDMPWGERVGRVRDPDGNLVNLATPPG